MPLHLPPLNSLRLFESAGRHRSFKLAAAELNMTPSAVSHGIIGLERTLGVELFVRETRQLSLTLMGKDYLPYISEALSLIAIGTQRLPSRNAGRPIAVSCAPTFASKWLLPRLNGFKDQWPGLSISVDTSREQVAFPVDGVDFAIRMSRAPVAGNAWSRLFGERLAPICTAAYLSTLVDEHGRVDLRKATLIHVTSASEDWQAWLDGNGLGDLFPATDLRVDTIQLAFDAAAAGLGIALGRKSLVDHDLATRGLVQAAEARPAETSYWLVSSAGADHRPVLRAFKRWMLSEAKAFVSDAASARTDRPTATPERSLSGDYG
jgi:LysR family glycine cleavage system transcriptional activator